MERTAASEGAIRVPGRRAQDRRRRGRRLARDHVPRHMSRVHRTAGTATVAANLTDVTAEYTEPA